MTVAPRTLVRVTLLAAVVAFCVVQDRVTAAGARRYVAAQRQALAAGTAPVGVDQIVRPAVRRSVQLGFVSAGVLCLIGFALAFGVSRGGGGPERRGGGGGS